MSLIPLGELLEKNILVSYKGHGSPPSRYKGRGMVPYIRVADIGNWDIYKNLTSRIPYNIYKSTKGVNGVDLLKKLCFFSETWKLSNWFPILSPFDKEVLLRSEITVLIIIILDSLLIIYYSPTGNHSNANK